MLIQGIQKTSIIDFPNNICVTVFTGGCNFRCPFCHNGDLVLPSDDKTAYPESIVLERLKNKKRIIDGVCITGGEPTLQPDLYDFICRVKEIPTMKVKLDTNGTNTDILQKLIEDELIDYVAMDIKTTKSKYNEIACMKNFDIGAIEASIELLQNFYSDYEFRTTVVEELHSEEDFEEIGEWIQGAPIYFLQAYRHSENVINPIFTTPSDEKMHSIMEIAKKYIPRVYIRNID